MGLRSMGGGVIDNTPWWSIDVGSVIDWLRVAAFAFLLGLSVFLAYELHIKNMTNAHLVWMLDVKLDSISDARVTAMHVEFDRMLLAALAEGGPRAVEALLRSTDR